jgi:hypothetical protein
MLPDAVLCWFAPVSHKKTIVLHTVLHFISRYSADYSPLLFKLWFYSLAILSGYIHLS